MDGGANVPDNGTEWSRVEGPTGGRAVDVLSPLSFLVVRIESMTLVTLTLTLTLTQFVMLNFKTYFTCSIHDGLMQL